MTAAVSSRCALPNNDFDTASTMLMLATLFQIPESGETVVERGRLTLAGQRLDFLMGAVLNEAITYHRAVQMQQRH